MAHEISLAITRQGKSCCNERASEYSTGQLQGVSDAQQYIGLCMNNSVIGPSKMQLEQGICFPAPDFPMGA